MSARCMLLVSSLLGASFAVGAEAAAVDVHVQSRDGKFLGSNVGGARVTIADAESGEVLAQGITEGSTGDTDLIMGDRKQGDPLITEGTAGFSTRLDLASPRQVRVTVHGPLDYPQAASTASVTHWLLPGESAGQGWIVELPGLIIDVHDVPALVALEQGEARLPIRAEVRLLCGCPFTPDGLWDSNGLTVIARVLLDDGREIASTPLTYAGEPSVFEGALVLARADEYRLSVQAHQRRAGNSGIHEQTLIVN